MYLYIRLIYLFYSRLLDKSEQIRGSYPIHVAVENESEKMVTHLLSVGASIEVYDKQGNSPVHLAASKSTSLILVRP